MSNQEELLYFKNSNNKNLFGIIHKPVKEEDKRGIIICNPIFEERGFTYRLCVNFARTACKRGYYVLQFDYFGNGDSEGEIHDMTVSSILDDLNSAYNFLYSQYNVKNVTLTGLRYGATLAAYYSLSNEKIKNLMLWNPIINVSKYVLEGLRKTIAIQTAAFKRIILNRDNIINNIISDKSSVIDGYDLASIDGFSLTKQLYEGLISQNLMDLNLVNKNIFHGCLVKPGQKAPREELDLWNSIKELNKVQFELIEEPVTFWISDQLHKNDSEALFSKSLTWLDAL